jgi:hypothetical protein
MPDTFAGFVADGAPALRDVPLPNGGKMTGVRRSYRRGQQSLELELSDTLHAPAVSQLIASQQGAERKAGKSEFRGASVGGHPAIVQWTAPGTAIVNMVVGGRFLANFRISPVESIGPALAAAESLPVSQIVKLAGPAAAAPAQPVSAE